MARKVRVVCGSVNGRKVNIEKRAVMAREELSCDRSFVMVPEELRRLYPNVKEEYIERALEDFGKYKFGDGESARRSCAGLRSGSS